MDPNDPNNPHRLHRSADPETSAKAAQLLLESGGERRQLNITYRIIHKKGTRGATLDDVSAIFKRIYGPRSNCSARISTLWNEGKILKTGYNRTSIYTGRECGVLVSRNCLSDDLFHQLLNDPFADNPFYNQKGVPMTREAFLLVLLGTRNISRTATYFRKDLKEVNEAYDVELRQLCELIINRYGHNTLQTLFHDFPKIQARLEKQ